MPTPEEAPRRENSPVCVVCGRPIGPKQICDMFEDKPYHRACFNQRHHPTAKGPAPREPSA